MKVDKRVKLSKEQKEEIILLKQKFGRALGDRKIAERYNVSRKTIQFILDPEKLVRTRFLAKERKKNLKLNTENV
jgi:hypothetical protein